MGFGYTYFVCGAYNDTQRMPRLGPALRRLQPERSQEQLLDVDQPTLARRDASTEFLGRGMHAIRKGYSIRPQLHFKPLFDTAIHDVQCRTSTNTQDQSSELRRCLIRWCCPPSVILSPKLRRIQRIVVMIGTVEPVVDQTV